MSKQVGTGNVTTPNGSYAIEVGTTRTGALTLRVMRGTLTSTPRVIDAALLSHRGSVVEEEADE